MEFSDKCMHEKRADPSRKCQRPVVNRVLTLLARKDRLNCDFASPRDSEGLFLPFRSRPLPVGTGPTQAPNPTLLCHKELIPFGPPLVSPPGRRMITGSCDTSRVGACRDAKGVSSLPPARSICGGSFAAADSRGLQQPSFFQSASLALSFTPRLSGLLR